MWRMLVGRADDLQVELVEHEADEERGTARWIARYTFTQTGRPVVNDVRARFRFSDGLFAEHVDKFNFWRWSRQALGPRAALLAWMPQMRLSVNRQAKAGLSRAMQEGNSAAPPAAQDG
jgi:hypothetical protein